MAKKIRKNLALAMVLMLIATAMILPAAAKNEKDGDSQTHIHGAPGSDIPFSKDDITVTIGGQDYQFTDSGNNSWKNDVYIGELGLNDEGDNSSIDVVITDSNNNVYDAQLVNHADQNGNNGNSKPGTDNYDLVNITLRQPEPTPDPTEEPTPDPTEEPTPDPTEDPTPNPTEEPTPDPTEDPDPTPDPTEDPDPTPDPTEDPDPTPDPTEDPDPTPDPTEDPDPNPNPTEDPDPTPDPTEDPDPTPDPTEDPDPTPDPTEDPNPNPNPNPNPTPAPEAPVNPTAGTGMPPIADAGPSYSAEPASGDVEILDEEVPLADVPKTGDISAIWLVLGGLSAAGLAITGKKRR